MSSELNFADLATGVRLAYVEQGPAAGAPVLLLHGYSDSQRSFDLLRPHLPRAWRVIAPALRGHGASEAPEDGYAIGDFARDAVALLDALGVGRAYVVGHSMGAAVALQMAADFPERVAGFAMLAAFSDFSWNAAAAELDAEVARFGAAVEPAFVRAFQESTLAGPVPDGFLDMVVGESMKLSVHVWRAAMRGMMSSDLPHAARRAVSPALIVWGDRDAFCTHADQLSLRARCASTRMVTLEGAGHAVHWERPAEVAAALVAFVSELEGARYAA